MPSAPRRRWSFQRVLFLGLWGALWGSLNAAPGQHVDAGYVLNLIHELRAYLPLLAGYVALAVWLMREAPCWRPWNPLGLLTLYGGVGALAAWIASPAPPVALYWAGSYLSVLAVLRACTVGPEALAHVKDAIRVNWILTTLIGVTLALFACIKLLPYGTWSFYNILGAVPAVAGMPMVRATGIGRYAAVMGLIALAYCLYEPRWLRRLSWGCGALCAAGFLGMAHSAGANLGFAVGVVVLIALKRNVWLLAGTLAGVVGIGIGLHEQVWSHLLRDKTLGTLLSGREEIWRAGVELFRDSPFLGWGFHADRLLLEWPYRNHISNAFLHALVQGGVLGCLPFIAAWGVAWVLLCRLASAQRGSSNYDRCFLAQVAGVQTFLTIRAIFESTGAFFGVDWLLLAPLFAYLYLRASTLKPALHELPPSPLPAGGAVAA